MSTRDRRPPRAPPWFDSPSPLADNDRGLDWIFDRDVECAPVPVAAGRAASAWRTQREHVAARSAFYRDKLGADLGAIELDGLADLPFTTKAELQQAQDEEPPFGRHLAADPNRVARRYQTSGTSGRPMHLALTDADLGAWLAIGLRSYHTTGVRPHNSVLSSFAPGPYVVGFTHDVIAALGAALAAPGPRNATGMVAAMTGGTIDTLLSTPTTALYLLDRVVEGGADPAALGIVHLILGGEPGGGLDPIRARLEEAFGAAVTEAMGLGDVSPSLFAECPAQQGMHFSGRGLVWPELVDAAGSPVPIAAGAEGEMVYTHLRREAMPLVRFRSGDQVRILTTECPCGRTTFTMRVLGRTDDVFIVRGVNVYPSAVAEVVAQVAAAATGRIRMVRPAARGRGGSAVRVEVETRRHVPVDDALAGRIAEALHARLRFRAAVDLLAPDAFGSAAYKTRAVRTAEAGEPAAGPA